MSVIKKGFILSRSPKLYTRLYSHFEKEYKRSVEDPQGFWAEAAESLIWEKKWDNVLNMKNGYDREWFQGAKINVSYNCLDRHVAEGRGDCLAVIYDDPVNKISHKFTYSQLLHQVERMTSLLIRKCNLRKKDRVVIYMPMMTECLIAMMACARAGLIHCVVFGGFSGNQLALRIKHCQANTIMTVNYDQRGDKFIDYIRETEEALNSPDNPIENCIVLNRKGSEEYRLSKNSNVKFYDWSEELESNKPHEGVTMLATDPLYILHTSGTTGSPKGVVRTIGDYAVALNWSMKNIYDCNRSTSPNEQTQPWWAASDFGWVVGHSYIAYGPLLSGIPTIIYQGKSVDTPDSSQYFRVLKEYSIGSCFVTPSALKSIRQVDENLDQSSKYLNYLDSSLKHMFIAGEHCDKETFMWIRHALSPKITISDHWWQTESGWPITAPCMGMYSNEEKICVPIGSTGKAVPGISITSLDIGNTKENSQSNLINDQSEAVNRILIKLPLPPGFASTLWQESEKFHDLYFKNYPGFYDTMDIGYLDENKNVFIISRSDDVINVSGHRLCTGSIEEACLSVHEVVECAVIAIPNELKGQEPLALVVLHNNVDKTKYESAKDSVKLKVREQIGPVAALSRVCIVPSLPKTRSGKISRLSLLNMASGKDIQIPATIENPAVYNDIYEELKRSGLNPTKPELK